MQRGYLLTLALLFLPLPASGQDNFFLRDGQKVVFVGDSNTFAGGYITYLDVYLFTRFPDKHFSLLNVGLPSETVSGLSEPDHPYPRPDVHTRLDRVLAKTRPDVVVACYGMNDGIYYPFRAERFARHKEGMRKLIGKAQKAGAKVVLLTTPPFDPLPVRRQLLPAGAAKYSWMKPYEKYDAVLRQYADWLVSLRKEGFLVVDVHHLINNHLAHMRQTKADYRLAGDGIHPNMTGHWLMAAALLQAWHAPAEVANITVDLAGKKVVAGQRFQTKLDGTDAGVVKVSWRSPVPLPLDSRWPKAFPEKQPLQQALNQYRLKILGAAEKRYDLYEGEQRLGTVTRQELADGVDLTRFDRLSTNQRSRQLTQLAEQRQQLLGRAWLTAIGHNRPNTPAGLPLPQAQKRAADLEQQMRQLAEPRELTLELRAIR